MLLLAKLTEKTYFILKPTADWLPVRKYCDFLTMPDTAFPNAYRATAKARAEFKML